MLQKPIARGTCGLLLILFSLTIPAMGAEFFQPVTQITGDYGYYRVDSAPAGADVVFDGKFVGETPITIPVFSSGSPGHVITLSEFGYVTWTRSYSLNPEPGQIIQVFAPLQPAETTGSVKVTSSPNGALVSLDGQQGQMSPWIYNNVPVGAHIVQAFLSGYSPYTANIEVTPGQTTEVHAMLPPLGSVGSLQVISSPGGADLYVDDVYKGKTSLTVGNLASGNHTVRLRLYGYQDLNGDARVDQGKTTILSLTLIPNTEPVTGNIVVSSSPSGAGIYLDDTFQGLTYSGQPVVLTGILPGEHIISLKILNYQDFRERKEVVAGQTIMVSATLAPSPDPGPFATMEIISQPSGASVYTDDIFRGITPLTLQSVPAGIHTVTIRISGYEDYKASLTLKPGQSALVSAALSPLQTPATTRAPLAPCVIISSSVIAIVFLKGKKQ